MTEPSPDGGALPPSPSSARPVLPHPFSGRTLLTLQIASREARLAELETDMITACEAAALGTGRRTDPASAREHWDRTAWQRYLATAMRLEPAYGPRMRRLRLEIGQLERLKTLLGAG